MTATFTYPQTTLTASDEADVVSTKLTTDLHVEKVAATDEHPDVVAGVPTTWIKKYAALAMEYATVTEVDPGVWYASVPFLRGAGIDGDSEAEALELLPQSIAGWVAVKLRSGARVPVIDGLDLNPRE
jgi:predicted RNase H-like HicB family nuclease